MRLEGLMDQSKQKVQDEDMLEKLIQVLVEESK